MLTIKLTDLQYQILLVLLKSADSSVEAHANEMIKTLEEQKPAREEY